RADAHAEGASECHRREVRRHHRCHLCWSLGHRRRHADPLSGRHDPARADDARRGRPRRRPLGRVHPGCRVAKAGRADDMNTELLIQLLANGLIVGTLYGVVAMSFVLIYKATQVVNFAQGEFLLIGAWVCWWLLTKYQLPFYIGMPITM